MFCKSAVHSSMSDKSRRPSEQVCATPCCAGPRLFKNFEQQSPRKDPNTRVGVGREWRGSCEDSAGYGHFAWRQNRPLTRPATAGENAVAGHPLPRGEGCSFSAARDLLPQFSQRDLGGGDLAGDLAGSGAAHNISAAYRGLRGNRDMPEL